MIFFLAKEYHFLIGALYYRPVFYFSGGVFSVFFDDVTKCQEPISLTFHPKCRFFSIIDWGFLWEISRKYVKNLIYSAWYINVTILTLSANNVKIFEKILKIDC